MSRARLVPLIAGLAPAFAVLAGAAEPKRAPHPRPGEAYRQYAVALDRGDLWRVTDPAAKAPGAREFLPNPVLAIAIDDLDGAVRAEAMIDRWGGHPGTSGKKVRFNGNAWIDVPEAWPVPAPGAAGPDPRSFMVEDNPVVEIPLAHLRAGENSFEGTCGGQARHSFDWGQWGWYGVMIRIYHGPGKLRAGGRIVSPRPGEILGEDPVLRIEAERPGAVARVEYVASFEGIDEDGDGTFGGWHEHLRGAEVTGLAGASASAPFEARWATRWVPDQPRGSLRILARIQGTDGLWSVTEPVEGLGLERAGSTVKLHRPRDVPERFWVRAGAAMSSKIDIEPAADLSRVREAAVVLRTWNGFRESFRLNGRPFPIGGANHRFALTLVPVPGGVLRPGENTVEFHAETEHHGVEVLWPGPCLVVRFRKGD